MTGLASVLKAGVTGHAFFLYEKDSGGGRGFCMTLFV